ncbi:ATP-dependent RNA helicase drs1 [Neolecta irregularis DAH-3]|uniref:RNA helicase n=1 Tax=Neolecta irregularis (strain DAH-3) TaxID=1198029 RepID=A0A1U7LV56_NEOID|nr:ATP-dependent RNA helicase drs1 [Neolecta irregularis DAH-3]|eukprot:OLL26565.1 ATP-dependent RNA helicase drs1 [Neolecta irregularis DAH-3]
MGVKTRDEPDEISEEDIDEDRNSDSDGSIAVPFEHPDDIASGSEPETAEETARRQEYFAGPSEDSNVTVTSFNNMNLSRPILKGLSSVGFSTPTVIQQKTIPIALLGKDVVGGAVTGSGKTAAFIVPILERLLYRPKKVPTSRVLIMCPTRELAMQCHSVAIRLATYTDFPVETDILGGLSLKTQELDLRKKPDVVIATPGRFIDHARNSTGFTIENIEIMVIDEADRMLEDGFAKELDEIIRLCPKSRQTMLFSATMTEDIDSLIRLSLNKPVRLLVDPKHSVASSLTQEFIRIRPQKEHLRSAMLLLLASSIYKNRVLVFFRSKVMAHRMRIIFGLLGFKAADLHGSLSQEQRVTALEQFRDGRVDFLLATDLASRGLDIKGIDVVINYEAPQSHDMYLHRVGRTARAGRNGCAVTLAGEADRKIVKLAVKSADAQKGDVRSRTLDATGLEKWAVRLAKLAEDVDATLVEEKEEKALCQAEMELQKGENFVKHEAEIRSRPARTWFLKANDKKVSDAKVNGPTKSKEKLSSKKRKKMLAVEKRSYKKTTCDRTDSKKKPQKKSLRR